MVKIIFTFILMLASFARAADPCFEKDAQPGTVCQGGAVFAGAIGAKNYMTTPTDGPETTWGSLNKHTGVIDPDNGAENTKKLVAISPPAKFCHDLQFAGYSDWFLPSQNELALILANSQQIKGFKSGDWYWSSTEAPENPRLKPTTVRGTSVSLGRMTNLLKSWKGLTRCVRAARP